MIDIERCKNCSNISPLLNEGLDEQAINKIAAVGLHAREAFCQSQPEVMPGGWTKCHTAPLAAAALRGANCKIVDHFETQDKLIRL